jgi:hypothetical protein
MIGLENLAIHPRKSFRLSKSSLPFLYSSRAKTGSRETHIPNILKGKKKPWTYPSQ